MKKISLLLVLFNVLFFFSCTNSYYTILKNSGQYEDSDTDLGFSYKIDQDRAKEIRDYFSENTDLNLNELYESSESSWEKSLKIAEFVSKNIKHANQNVQPEKMDSISLWEYHLNVEQNFNCKYHSIFTNELLLSVGIVNRYVWCMPKSDKDTDCHVVNNVWIPELSKWVMIDTDQCTYICDKSGTLLSIQEIRQKMIDEEHLKVSSFEQMMQSTSEYLEYLSKDFYWFTTLQKIRFIQDVNNSNPNNYINLLPNGFKGFRIDENEIITHDENAFWCDLDFFAD